MPAAGEASVDLEDQGPAFLEERAELGGHELVAHAEGDPDLLRVGEGEGALEAGWGDADDGERIGVEGDGAADDLGVAGEGGGPEGVAHDRDGVAALALVFLGEEGAAAGGFDAQDVEVAGAGDLDVDLFRGAVDEHGGRQREQGGHVPDGGVLLAEVPEVER